MEDLIVAVSAISAMLAFSSPGIAMLVVQSTLRYAPYSYAFGLTSCILWIPVGVREDRTALFRLSCFGVLAFAAYLVAFILNSEADDRRRTCLIRYVGGGSLAVLLVGVMLYFLASDAAYNDFCSTISCLTSLAPLWNLPAVCRTRSTDSMPSVIVAGLGLTNAVVSTLRNTVGAANAINRNLAIPSGVALFSTLVQVVLHLVCWCLPRPRLAPPAIDNRPLLGDQTEAEGSVHEDEVDDGRRSTKHDNPNEMRVDVQTLEKLAQDKDETIEIKNIFLPRDAQHGQEEVAHDNEAKIIEIKDVPLPQEDKITKNDHEEVAQDTHDKIFNSNTVPLHQEGKKDQEEVAHENHDKIFNGNILPLPQNSHEKDNAEHRDLAAVSQDKAVMDVVEVKPERVVPSEECATSRVDQVHPAVPQGGTA